MTEDVALIAITALLPLTAMMLILQANPYHALVIRGILGSVAALVYALLGAADVALTEALVGTMLSITLYAVAVRSSMNMRVGILETGQSLEPLFSSLQNLLDNHHMRLERVSYKNLQTLQAALMAKEIHTCATVIAQPDLVNEEPQSEAVLPPVYDVQTRVQRLHEIMQSELSSTQAQVAWVDVSDLPTANVSPLDDSILTQQEG